MSTEGVSKTNELGSYARGAGKRNMALSTENGVKQVPWSSLSEWHDVYKQIYSNDTVEQTKAYETLLAWKARMPKLPVGVECTLSILQVCLRDREWSSKIDNGELPMYCENDLSLMYSTTIMRILNHITNIGHTKQTSLFRIAKEIKIPEWIVGLRHNAAHGHELAPLGVLRIAINILLEWLHEEYWAAEACTIEECYMKETNRLEEEEESEQMQGFTDLFELWTSVSLYIHAGHRLVSDIPDKQLRKTLKELRKYVISERSNKESTKVDEYVQQADVNNVKSDKDYNLTAAQALLLSEISVCLTQSKSVTKKDNVICNMLCENEAFLPNSDIMQIFLQKGNKKSLKKRFLPSDMLRFWKDIIILIHKKGMIEALIFKLLKIVDDEQENKEKRKIAALWINTVFYSFVQLNIAHSVCRSIEYTLKETGIELSTKDLSYRVKKHIHSSHVYMLNVLWLDISSTLPTFLNIKFLSMLLLRINEFTAEFVKPILELVTPKIDTQTKNHLLSLLQIYTFKKHNNDNSEDVCEKIFTVEDLRAISVENKIQEQKKKYTEKETARLLADQIIRNLHWKLALDYQWIGCPIGLLPWQNSVKSLELKPKLPKHTVSALDSQIVAGIVNNKNLKMKSRIDWDNVLRAKKKIKMKRDDDVTIVIMNRALEVAKKQ